MKGCNRDTDGDGNCPLHPKGCPELTLGVGSGDTGLFVHGGSAAINRVRDIILEWEQLRAAATKAEAAERRKALIAEGRFVADAIIQFSINAGSMMAHDRAWRDKIAYLVTDNELLALHAYLNSLAFKPHDSLMAAGLTKLHGIEVRNR